MAPRVKLHFLLCFDRMKSLQLAKKKTCGDKISRVAGNKMSALAVIGWLVQFSARDPLDQWE